ncbi:tropinone reductase-like protein 3 [Tanacetum coccineum]
MDATSSTIGKEYLKGKYIVTHQLKNLFKYCFTMRLALGRISIHAVEKIQNTKVIEVLGVVCHVSNAQQRKNLIEQTVESFAGVSGNGLYCVLCANGIIFHESTLDKLWEINIKTAILLLQDASPHLTKGSSIVFISSLSAFQPPSSMAMYGVTKTALLGLTKRNAIEEKTPFKRLGTPEDMAAATAFLASDEASYITGETIVVAGGMSSRLGVSSSLSGRAVSDGSSPCGRAAGIGCDSSPCALTVGDGSSPCRRAADIGSLT